MGNHVEPCECLAKPGKQDSAHKRFRRGGWEKINLQREVCKWKSGKVEKGPKNFRRMVGRWWILVSCDHARRVHLMTVFVGIQMTHCVHAEDKRAAFGEPSSPEKVTLGPKPRPLNKDKR